MMKLVDHGKVNLDCSITDYIPEFTMSNDRYKKITVRMLLNHSSGLMGSTFKNVFLLNDNDTSSHDQLLPYLQEQRLKVDPGVF